jgi:hypothetical protein
MMMPQVHPSGKQQLQEEQEEVKKMSVDHRTDYHKSADNQAGRAAWEGAYKATWDMVQEDEEGGIQHSVDSFMARARRKRYVTLTSSQTE